MSRVIAIIPARAGSKGIKNKNFTALVGISPMERALRAVLVAGLQELVVTTDAEWSCEYFTKEWPEGERYGAVGGRWLKRPAELAQDDTPMIAVVQHVLEQIQGEPDDIILLVQPTQPLRKPEHLTAAITLLQESGADSVVSVVALPLTHSPDSVLDISYGYLRPWLDWYQDEHVGEGFAHTWREMPLRRQDAHRAYVRDGTVYAFWRRSVTPLHFYGEHVRPLIIPAAESCPLDTPEDWLEAERRLRATT